MDSALSHAGEGQGDALNQSREGVSSMTLLSVADVSVDEEGVDNEEFGGFIDTSPSGDEPGDFIRTPPIKSEDVGNAGVAGAPPSLENPVTHDDASGPFAAATDATEEDCDPRRTDEDLSNPSASKLSVDDHPRGDGEEIGLDTSFGDFEDAGFESGSLNASRQEEDDKPLSAEAENNSPPTISLSANDHDGAGVAMDASREASEDSQTNASSAAAVGTAGASVLPNEEIVQSIKDEGGSERLTREPAETQDEDKASVEDDEDFGVFNRSEPLEQESNGGEGFGDFGAAPQVTSSFPKLCEHNRDGDGDDDDFGDFGAAPKLPETSEEPIGLGVDDADEDDDDFGDFDSAPTARSEASPGSSLAMTSTQGQPQHALRVENAEPVVVQRARTLFPNLFARNDTAMMDSASDNDVSSKDEIISISDVLSANPYQEMNRSKLRDSSLLFPARDQSLLKGKPPRTVTIDDGRGAYSYYLLPLANRGLPSARTRLTKKLPHRLSIKGLPELLDIHLPTPNDKPIDMASPVTESRKTLPSEADRGSVPSAPSNDSAADELGGASDASAVNGTRPRSPSRIQKVQDFLSRVPDLSFMLSSGLASPKGNS